MCRTQQQTKSKSTFWQSNHKPELPLSTTSSTQTKKLENHYSSESMSAGHVDDASLKRKHEEIASNATGDDSEDDDDARIPKPLDHFPEEVRAVMREKWTEIRSLSAIFEILITMDQHLRFSETIADNVRQAIEECPDIVRVGCPNHPSLLQLLCNHPSDHSLSLFFADAIKVAIEKNPFALHWPDMTSRGNEDGERECLFGLIAYNEYHSRLLPWIVENYGHILCSRYLQHDALHFDLVSSYAHGLCDAATVRMFYEAYPNALQQKSKRRSNRVIDRVASAYEIDSLSCQFVDTGQRYPLHYAMREEQPDLEDYELFEWMIQQNPDAIQNQDPVGQTILHQIFLDYAVFMDYASTVIDIFTGIVFIKDSRQNFPILYLSARLVSQVRYSSLMEDMIMVRLLRLMFSAKIIDDDNLRKDSFIERIQEVLETQHQLSMNSVQIRRVEMMIDKAIAAKSGDTSVLSEVKEVYGDWSQKHLPAIKAAIKKSTREDIPRVRSETRVVQNEQEEESSDDEEERDSSDEGDGDGEAED